MATLGKKKYPVVNPGDGGLLSQQYQSAPMRGLLDYPEFGMRHDNSAPKGLGYFGLLENAANPPYNTQFSTELSVGVPIGGMEREVPALVPSLVPQEIDWLLNGGEVTTEITDKAYEHAMRRLKNGLSPFAD